MENRSWSSQCLSLYDFQKLHFIWDWFGCKLWLSLIQNHARHRFQAFAHSHMKLLCCLIRIWADFQARSFLSHVSVLDLHLLLCTGFNSENYVLYLWHFLLRDQWMIERLSESMTTVLVCNNLDFMLIPWKISFHMKNKTTPEIHKAFITFDSQAESV